MYQTIFTNDQLLNNDNLSYNINVNSCSVKIENRSRFALDVFNGVEQVDRINPYSFIILKNDVYNVKVNKTIEADQTEKNDFIAFKSLNQSVEESLGSTTFTGITTVNGDMNITNAVVPITAPNGIDVNIQNATVPISGSVDIKSGTINANIENAKIGTEILNAKLATNNLVPIVDTDFVIYNSPPTQPSYLQPRFKFEMGVYDTFIVKVEAKRDKTNEPLYILDPFEKGENHLYFSTYFDILPILDQKIEYGKIESVEPPTGEAKTHMMMRKITFDRDVIFDTINLFVKHYQQEENFYKDGVLLNVKIYGYNSSFNKKFKGVEVDKLNVKEDFSIDKGYLQIHPFNEFSYSDPDKGVIQFYVSGANEKKFLSVHYRSGVDGLVKSNKLRLNLNGELQNENPKAATLLNGWKNYGSVYSPVSYWKDKNGIVHLNGLINGTAATNRIMFTLPLDYRPSYNIIYTCESSSSASGTMRVDVAPNGNVYLYNSSGFPGWLSLDSISFRSLESTTLSEVNLINEIN